MTLEAPRQLIAADEGVSVELKESIGPRLELVQTNLV